MIEICSGKYAYLLKFSDLLETMRSIMERRLGETTERTEIEIEELKEMLRGQTASAEKSKQEG